MSRLAFSVPTRMAKMGVTNAGCRPGMAMQTRPPCAIHGNQSLLLLGRPVLTVPLPLMPVSVAPISAMSLAPKCSAETNKNMARLGSGYNHQRRATVATRSI